METYFKIKSGPMSGLQLTVREGAKPVADTSSTKESGSTKEAGFRGFVITGTRENVEIVVRVVAYIGITTDL